jgi:hypothetical protein
LVLLAIQTLQAQENDGYGVNLPRFYKQKLHFGFTIAGNRTDFRLNPRPNSSLPDTMLTGSRFKVRSVFSEPSSGFGIGLVGDLRLHEYVRLRFTPNISFAVRKINYKLGTRDNDSMKIFQKTVESVFLIFPVEVKIQSKRLANFSAYIIGGGGYSLDLSSRKKAGSATGANQLDDNVKLKGDDLFFHAGAGTDFYLQYFKLGFEIKLLIGTLDLLRKENSVFTNSLDKIRSHMVLFTFTFEG